MDIPMPPVVQPRGLMEYANEASNFRNSQQQNRLNDLKLQYAPQQMEMEQQTSETALAGEKDKQEQQKLMFASGMAKTVKSQAQAKAQSLNISPDTPEYEEIVNTEAHKFGPRLAGVMGQPYDPNIRVDSNMINTLASFAGPTAQEQAQAELQNKLAERQALFPMDIQLAQARAEAVRPPVSWNTVQEGAYQINPQTGESRATGVAPKQTEQKPLQEWQVKQVDFLNRTNQANDIIENIGKDYSPSFTSFSKWTEGVPLVGKAVNAALSPNEQQINQAQRQFINSTLRRESGAAIGKDEFESAQQQYFPMPNDSAETLAQKAQARATVIQGLKTGLPENLMPQTAMPQNSDNISIDIKHPENLSEEDRQALQADINATKATNKPQGKLKFIGFE